MQKDEFLHIFHLFAQWQFQFAEQWPDHFRPDHFVSVETPTGTRIESFGAGFADVVQQCSPAQVEVVAFEGHIVEHLERVQEVIFVRLAVTGLDPFQCAQFRKDQFQQSAVVEQLESDRRDGREHNLVHFGDDALLRDDFDPFAVAADRLERLVFDVETELCGEADRADHA